MKLIQVTAALAVLLASASCSSETAPVDLASPAMPDSFWVEGPMADAVEVLSAKQSPSGSVVVVKGQVQDFGELATFRLVDSSLPPCTDQCPTPWDFCCEDPSDVAAADKRD